jgi:hypothetical protein
MDCGPWQSCLCCCFTRGCRRYYLLAPLLLYVCFRFFRSPLQASLVLSGILLIFSLTAAAVCNDRESAFLLLPSHAWELLAGALLAMCAVYWDDDCLHRASEAIESLLAAADLVVFAENWGTQPDYAQDVRESVACYQELRSKTHARVWVLGAKSFGWNNDFVRLSREDVRHLRVIPLASVVGFNNSAREPDFSARGSSRATHP